MKSAKFLVFFFFLCGSVSWGYGEGQSKKGTILGSPAFSETDVSEVYDSADQTDSQREREGGNPSQEDTQERRVVMFWNLENFFDYIDQGTSDSDAEFSSRGTRHWTKSRFYTKCDAVAKMIFWVGDKYGSLPAVVGFAEVENAWAIRAMLNSTALKKCGYSLVHYESPDSRGIDVALIYREDIYELLSAKPCHIYLNDSKSMDFSLISADKVDNKMKESEEGKSATFTSTGKGNGYIEMNVNTIGEGDASVGNYNEREEGRGAIMNTRDILLVSLQDKVSGEITYFAVNHHPSKYGGEVVSRPKRLAAMTRLQEVCDSVLSLGQTQEIIAMGDFNDTPDNPLFGIFGDTMVNKSLPLFKKGRGTIKYNGKWELIDMFIISSAIAEDYRMEIVEAPFHTQSDNAHVGNKPFRTYSGPRYIGGISDHFPIVLLPSTP